MGPPPTERSYSADRVDMSRPNQSNTFAKSPPRKPLIENSPLTLSQDNAFPVFPTLKSKSPKPDDGTFGGLDFQALSLSDSQMSSDHSAHASAGSRPPLPTWTSNDSNGPYPPAPPQHQQPVSQQPQLNGARPPPATSHSPVRHHVPTPPNHQTNPYVGPFGVPANSDGGHARDMSTGSYLGNAYDDYLNEPMPLKTREAEIEAEMPDFDNPRPRLDGPRDPVFGGMGGLTNDAPSSSTHSLPLPPAHDRHDGFDGYHAISQPNLAPHPPRHASLDTATDGPSPANTMIPFSVPGNGPMPPRRSPVPQPGYAPQAYNGPPGQHNPYELNGPPRSIPGPNDLRAPGRAGPMNPYGPARGSLDQQRPPISGPANVRGVMTGSAPEPESQSVSKSNPDALPSHPTPVRAGLLNKPPPPSSGQPIDPIDRARMAQTQPVTRLELDKLQSQVTAYPQDQKLAYQLCLKLAEAASVLASNGGQLDTRESLKNKEKYQLDAHRRLKKLASNGYADAMFYLADCYSKGSLGLNPDAKEAFGLYQSAGKVGHAEGSYRTALCCELGPDQGGGTRLDPEKAVLWYRRAAQLGNIDGMFKLGVILSEGLLGANRAIREGEAWFKSAAERADKDHPYALHKLALMYDPQNVDPAIRSQIAPDPLQARNLFQKAARLGLKTSQSRLGYAYEYGELGLPIEPRSSIAWYSKAAAQGDHTAELALSGWYLTGSDGILERSDQEAYLWARKAATSEPPLSKALFAMGYYTEQGIGCPQSVEEAKKWYTRAAFYKFPKAVERLEELKKGGKAVPLDRRVEGTKLNRVGKKERNSDCVVM